jgi:hypothetical protein
MFLVCLIIGAIFLMGVIKLVFYALEDPAWREEKRRRRGA